MPAPTSERLAGLDRNAAQRFGLDDLVTKLRTLIAGGAPGANFNVIVPGDAEVIVEAMHALGIPTTQAGSAC